MGKIECSGEETKLEEGWGREYRKGKMKRKVKKEGGNYNNSKNRRQ